MDNNMLDISLREILKLSKGEDLDKQVQLEKSIENNSEEIKKLSEQMKVAIEFNKEIKKLLTGMAEQIKVLTKEITNKEVSNKVVSISEELKEISNELNQTKQINEGQDIETAVKNTMMELEAHNIVL